MPMSSALLKFGDEKSSAGFEHPIHLLDRSTLIIFSHMVQSERAREGIESGIRERQLLREGDLETDRYSVILRSGGGELDHFWRRIDAMDGAAG